MYERGRLNDVLGQGGPGHSALEKKIFGWGGKSSAGDIGEGGQLGGVEGPVKD